MKIKLLLATMFLSCFASLSSATTLLEYDCLTVDAVNDDCNGLGVINLAQVDTTWLFEGNVGVTDGSLTIMTETNPYWSSGFMTGSIQFYSLGGQVLSPTGAFAAQVDWGGNTFNLAQNAFGLWVADVWAIFDPELPNAMPLVLSWTGLDTGGAISMSISAVPLPAGALLLLTALGGLGLVRRRRSAEPALA